MRRFKFISLLIIIFLTISLVLTGCRSKDENKDTSVDIEQEEVAEVEEEIDSETEEDEEESDVLEEEVEEEDREEAEEEAIKEETSERAEKPKETQSDKSSQDEIQDEIGEEGSHILKLEGRVGKELRLSLKDLKAMDNIIFQGDFYSINNFGTTSHTNFKGVNLWKLLEEANISSEATKVSIIATDGYMMEFTLEQVKRQDYIDETDPGKKFPMIIAWEENGVEYDPDEGPPFKLVVGQKEAGDVNKPQWVSNIDRIVVE